MAAWIIVTQWISRLVLLILMGLSVWSVSIMIDRWQGFMKVGGRKKKKRPRAELLSEMILSNEWKKLRESTHGASDLPSKMVYYILELDHSKKSVPHQKSDQVQFAVRSFLNSEKVKLEKGFTVLATLGSNAPFIGLFGTVLGIIQAFGALSDQQTGAFSSVIAGISEALVATAVGLFVAIPAVIAYNFFSRQLKLVLSDCESVRDLILSRAESMES